MNFGGCSMKNSQPIKNNKGAALALVIMLMGVLSVLGITMLTISLAENKQAIYQVNKTQAYYLARSGAEAVAEHIIESSSSDDIMDKTSKPTQLGNGTFKVSVTKEDEDIVIKSTGEVHKVNQDVTLVLTPEQTGGAPLPPADIDTATALEWMNGGSHTIKDIKDIWDKPVEFESGNTQITIKTISNKDPDFTAPSCFFTSSLRIVSGSTLTLEAGEIIFNKEIFLDPYKNKNNLDGKLILEVQSEYAENGENIEGGTPGTKYGKVYFSESVKLGEVEIVAKGSYYFPSGIILQDQNDELILFDDGNTNTIYKKTWK